MSTLTSEDHVRPRTVVAILNPVAGTTNVHRVAGLLADVAEDVGVDLTLRFSREPRGITQIARECAPGVDRLIAVGGDGTFSEVVAGAGDADVTLAIVAAGSSNMVARELNLPLDTTAAVRLALTGTRVRRIDTAQIDERFVVHMAGAGFDAALMRDTPAWLKRRIGASAYAVGAVRNLGVKPFPVSIEVDGERHEVTSRIVLLALGGGIMRPRFQLGDGIDRSDGVLDVLTFNPPHVLGTLGTFWWIARGQPERARWLRHLRGRRVRLTSPTRVATEVDGDVLDHLPMEVTISPHQVRVVVPDDGRV